MLCDTIDIVTAHRQLGHLAYQTLKKLFRDGHIKGLKLNTGDLNYSTLPFCPECTVGKMSRLPFPTSVSCASKPLNLIHSDLAGPLTPQSLGRAKYLVTYLDDYSGYSWVYSLKSKSDQLNIFKQFKATAELQVSRKLCTLRTDCGGEYMSMAHKTFLTKHGVTHCQGFTLLFPF